MANIHPTAIVSSSVKLGNNVTVGPYCVLEGDITIGDDCVLHPFIHMLGWVNIGQGTVIHAGAAIGGPPQDLSYKGTPGLVEIGEKCTLREYVTVHTPIRGDEGLVTHVGNRVYLMANAHIAHNVQVDDDAIIANGALAAGFVEIGKSAFISGNVGIHQFCRLGAYVIVGAVSKVAQDIPPYMMLTGNPGRVNGLNSVGLRRGGFSVEQRNRIKQAYKILYSGISFKEAADRIEKELGQYDEVTLMLDMVRTSKRGIVSHMD